MSIRVYGIPNCDTVKKSRAWLTTHGADLVWHDFRKDGVPVERLSVWVDTLGWEALVNRQGTTWRKLPDERKAAVFDAASAIALMIDQPSVIKRPVVEWPDGPVTAGYSEALFAERLARIPR